MHRESAGEKASGVERAIKASSTESSGLAQIGQEQDYMKGDPRREERDCEDDVLTQLRVKGGERKMEGGKLHEGCEHEYMRPLPADEEIDEDEVDDVVRPACHYVDTIAVPEGAYGEIAIQGILLGWAAIVRG